MALQHRRKLLERKFPLLIDVILVTESPEGRVYVLTAAKFHQLQTSNIHVFPSRIQTKRKGDYSFANMKAIVPQSF